MARDAGPEDAQSDRRLGYFARNQFFFSLLLPAFLLGTGRGFTIPVLPVIARDEFNASVAGASLFVIAPLFGGVLSTLPTGYVIDRFGRRVTLIGAPLIASAAAFAAYIASSYIEFLIYLTVAGVAQQMWQMSRLAAIADAVPSDQRGRQITRMNGIQRVGTMAGPFLGGLLGEFLGLRVPFLVFGALGLLAAVPSYFLIKETAPTVLARRAGEKQEDSIPLRRTLTKPVLSFFGAQFLANVGRGGAVGNGGSYVIFAAFAYGANAAELGAVLLGTGIVGVPIMLLSGQIMDRFGRKRQIVPGALMLGAGISLMTVTAAFELPFSVFIGAFVWINLGVSMMAGTMQTLGADIAPPNARGRFFRREQARGGSRLDDESRELRPHYRIRCWRRRIRRVVLHHGGRSVLCRSHGRFLPEGDSPARHLGEERQIAYAVVDRGREAPAWFIAGAPIDPPSSLMTRIELLP